MISLLSVLLPLAAAECPNACSGHGACGSHDMCTCYRNWQAADCSLRTCPFGLAHVDSPKGDLDGSSGALSAGSVYDNGSPVLTGSTVYPAGTTELYPFMTDSEYLTQLSETAHAYMECSNKGLCDRKAGECECFEGYEGSSCQRASCPNSCSGHGTCETIRELAEDDADNIYMLWDKDISMGCKCDAGYSGPDCSSRMCKYGIDPLYVDDAATARVNHVNVLITGAAGSVTMSGTYAIKFYDVFGEDYVTGPIDVTASTADVAAALLALPSNVIPSVTVGGTGFTSATGGDTVSYDIKFTGNPGNLKEIEIVTYLDGDRRTVTNYLSDIVYYSGIHGEFTDFFAKECVGVEISFGNCKAGATTCETYESAGIASMTTDEAKLLKKCLGDSDGDMTNNVEVYNWDHGSMLDFAGTVSSVGNVVTTTMGAFPHVFKVVDAAAVDDFVGGIYMLGWWHDKKYTTDGTNFDYPNGGTAEDAFKIATKSPGSGQYKVFATDGVAQVLGFEFAASADGKLTDMAYNTGLVGQSVFVKDSATAGAYSEHRVFASFTKGSKTVYTNYDTSCETTTLTYASYDDPLTSGNAAGLVAPCLQKGDWVFLMDLNSGTNNAGTAINEYIDGYAGSQTDPANVNGGTGNLYQITKIYKAEETSATWTANDGITENKYRFTVDKSLSWTSSTLSDVVGNPAYKYTGTLVVKFTPADSSSYTYVAECSNRGTCDGDGICECFKGYTGDDCSLQSSLAV